jgi:FSR family fosmidomycin resistance protein-like MFS transporter
MMIHWRNNSVEQKEKISLRVLFAIGLAHCLNDMTQWIVIALYPLFKDIFALSFTQIGFLSFAYQMCASVLQPGIGYLTDRRQYPHVLPAGMAITLLGLLLMAFSPGYVWLLLAASLLGVGSAVFHPESSRVAYLASAGHYGFAQSLFQVGGSVGQALGPLIAALFVVTHGQRSLALFSVIPLFTIISLFSISRWTAARKKTESAGRAAGAASKPRSFLARAMGILFLLMLSKQVYTVSIANFFTFYLTSKFGVSLETSQVFLFFFLGAVALGTFVGGPIGDRIGRKWVIWVSILGAAPFSLALPYVDLHWTAILVALIGFIMASSFSAILVFAQELMPGHIGAIAGLFFGLAFGLGGIGAAILGTIADRTSIYLVYKICSFLPLIGLLTFFLPAEQKRAT